MCPKCNTYNWSKIQHSKLEMNFFLKLEINDATCAQSKDESLWKPIVDL